MNMKLVLAGMVLGSVIPLADANARTLVDPSVNITSAGTALRSTPVTAENFGRQESQQTPGGQGPGNPDRGGGPPGDKSPCTPK